VAKGRQCGHIERMGRAEHGPLKAVANTNFEHMGLCSGSVIRQCH